MPAVAHREDHLLPTARCRPRSEEHTSELQSQSNLVCRLLLEKKKTTRQELVGNNSVLAGRAVMLLVQQLYRKAFKKGEPTKSNSVFNKLDVDVGNVDPRTGQQTVTARVRLNEQFVLIGDLGVGGDFRGMVKYLIRFK